MVISLRRRNGLRLEGPPEGLRAEPAGFRGVRLSQAEVERGQPQLLDGLASVRARLAPEETNILALSGGAAGGAFGAGALVGLTRAGQRPDFALVTGVSTGALLAPFAYLGPKWDERLEDGYTGGHAAGLLSLKTFSPRGLSLFRGEALDSLVQAFIDQDVVDAVAREHARGRRLLVATTNIDNQRPSVWDMGAIASHGGEPALKLFRQVLAASASLPGVFPPRLFDVEAGGETYQEMHMDGGLASALFVIPDAILHGASLDRRLGRGRVFVIVNTVLGQTPRTTPARIVPVLMRSFDTMLRYGYRQALRIGTAYCEQHGLPLYVATIPAADGDFNMLRFETANMKKMFACGLEQATTGKLWSRPIPEPPQSAFAWTSSWAEMLRRPKVTG
jgi:predicted patatin/cPLA2 family phospholipase